MENPVAYTESITSGSLARYCSPLICKPLYLPYWNSLTFKKKFQLTCRTVYEAAAQTKHYETQDRPITAADNSHFVLLYSRYCSQSPSAALMGNVIVWGPNGIISAYRSSFFADVRLSHQPSVRERRRQNQRQCTFHLCRRHATPVWPDKHFIFPLHVSVAARKRLNTTYNLFVCILLDKYNAYSNT